MQPQTVGKGQPAGVTALLREWGQGDEVALARLIPLVHAELHRIARRSMRNERPGITLQATALVNEAYLRLVGVEGADWRGRTHFFAVSAQVMRRILVDAARARYCDKRGAGRRVDHSTAIDFDAVADMNPSKGRDLIALDDALDALAQIDPRKARVIELRYFGGLTVEETAGILKISPQSVLRDWKLAKAWLHRELNREQ